MDRLHPKTRNANAAMKIAVSQTKKQLKDKAKTKVITTYPKGLYKRTLKQNLCESMKTVELGNGKCKTKAKPTPVRRKKKRTLAGTNTKATPKKTTKKKSSPKKKGFLDKLFNK